MTDTREKILSACAGKEPLTRAVANQIARRMAKRRGQQPVHAYQCRHCEWWHLGADRRIGKAA